MLCDDPDARPRTTVQKISYLGCIEITAGGMILVGDRVRVAGKEIGEVVGFDETHAPNHLNIVVRVDGELLTGAEMGIQLEDPLIFSMSDAYKAKRGT
jgi:hypothetical protein